MLPSSCSFRHADGRLIDLSVMGLHGGKGALGPTLIEPSRADRRIVKTRKKVVAGWRTALQSPQVQLVHLFAEVQFTVDFDEVHLLLRRPK
jgi:hypothetical protein